MSNALANLKLRNMTVSAVVTRADGGVEDLGVIVYKDANLLKTVFWYLCHPKQMRHKIRKFFGAAP